MFRATLKLKEYSKKDIVDFVHGHVNDGKRILMNAVLTALGYDAIYLVPESRYNELMTRLKKAVR